MPTLFEQLDTSLGTVDISVTLDGEAQKLVTIAETLARLIDHPPDEFGDYLALLAELELPDLGVTDNLAPGFDALRDLIPEDLASLNGNIIASLDSLEQASVTGIAAQIQPAIDAINGFYTLFRGDPSCGLVPGVMGSPALDPTGEPVPPAPTSPPSPAPAPGEPNPGPQNPLVSDAQLAEAKAIVDGLPSPLTVENLLPWLAGFWGNSPLPYNLLRAVPLLDDLRGPLHSLSHWNTLSGSGILAEFARTIDQVSVIVDTNTRGVIEELAQQLAAALSALDTASLSTASASLTTRLATVRDAVTAGNLAGIEPDLDAIDAAIAQLQTVHGNWQGGIELSLAQQVSLQAQLAVTLEDHLIRVIGLLQDRPALGELLGQLPLPEPGSDDPDLQALEELFGQVQDFLETALDAIDLGELLAPVAETVSLAGQEVEQIRQQLVTLMLEVDGRLQGLSDAIDGIDTGAALTSVNSAVQHYATQLRTQLTTGFASVRSALETAMTELGNAVDSFDPAALHSEVENVIDTISAVFDNPDVQGAIAQLQQLGDLADNLDAISFTPISDTVIEGINSIKSALDAIDESSLDPPLPQMLGTAMSALPADTAPLTDPLVDRLGDLVEQGPVAVLEQIKQYPARVFDEVRKYDPQTLLGDRLEAPYKELLEEAERFSPQELLTQVEAEFDRLRQRLKDNVSPGTLLQPLVALHRQLATELEQLNPAGLVEPLDQKLQSVLQALGDAIDLAPLLEPLAGVIEVINQQVDKVSKGIELVQHVLDKLAELADAPAQLDDWLEGIIDRIPDDIDISPLSASLNDLAAALDNSRALALRTHVAAQYSPIDTLLENLDAGSAVTGLVETVSGISRSAVEALPASPERTRLLNLLDNFNVTSAEITGPLQQLAALTTVRAQAAADLELRLNGWDQRHHRSGGTLDDFRQPDADIGQVKTWLRDAIERQVTGPLRALFTKLALMHDIASQFITLLDNLLSQIDERIAGLLAAPEAIVALGETVQALVDEIAGINLDVLQDNLAASFDAVRDKFNALNPASLQATLDTQFDDIIDGLDLDLIIPPDSFDALNDSFTTLREQLDTLNPGTLLVEPLQEVFDENIQPVIDSLDVTPLLQAVIDRLTPLEDELRGEMDRVNSAYRAMLAAAPGSSVSVSVSIGQGGMTG